MKRIIGIDIGGSKISVVLGTPSGKILRKELLVTKKNKRVPDSVGEIVAVIRHLSLVYKVKKDLLGIGVGVPGAIDSQKGVVGSSPNMPGWKGVPLKKIFSKQFKKPVFMDNDANAACLGEKAFGAAKKLDDFIYLTLSTGIGGGIMASGKLVHGGGGYAGEVGHANLYLGGRRCGCGKRGCFEAHASGTAISKIAKGDLKKLSKAKSERSKILREAKGNFNKVDAFAVEKAARAGDRLAKQIYRQVGYDLGLALSNLIFTLNPEAIFLGGSVTRAFPLFALSMRRSLRENSWKVPLSQCKVRKSSLGDGVADLGAIALVLNN